MSKEFIYKKLNQIIKLISELESLLDMTFPEFSKNFTTIRSAERNFQLMVEQASDINNHMLLELGNVAPDSYKSSFIQIVKIGIIDNKILKDLIKSSNLRNILIHEYDFDQDNFIFYKSAKKLIPVYKEYVKAIEKYLNKK